MLHMANLLDKRVLCLKVIAYLYKLWFGIGLQVTYLKITSVQDLRQEHSHKNVPLRHVYINTHGHNLNNPCVLKIYNIT